MTYVSGLDDQAARDERAEAIRASRAASRGGTPSPTVMPTSAEKPAARPPAFVLVDDLPDGGPGRRGGGIPDVRRDLIAFALAHPGSWLKYTPGEREPVKVKTVATLVNKHQGGFDDVRFEGRFRAGDLYVRIAVDGGES